MSSDDSKRKKRLSIAALVVMGLGMLFVLPNLPALTGQAGGSGAEAGCAGAYEGEGSGDELATGSAALSAEKAQVWYCHRQTGTPSTVIETNCWPTRLTGDATGKTISPPEVTDWTVNNGRGNPKEDVLQSGHWACEPEGTGTGPEQVGAPVRCEISSVALAGAESWLCQNDEACFASGILGDATGKVATPTDFRGAKTKQEVLDAGDWACGWAGNGHKATACERSVTNTFTGFGSGYCDAHYEERPAATTVEACAEQCRSTPGCTLFSLSEAGGTLGCRVSKCAAGQGAAPCPANKHCTVGTDADLIENNSLYGLDILDRSACGRGLELNEARTQCVLKTSPDAISGNPAPSRNPTTPVFSTGTVAYAWWCQTVNNCWPTLVQGDATGQPLVVSDWSVNNWSGNTEQQVLNSGNYACRTLRWGEIGYSSKGPTVTCQSPGPTPGWTIVGDGGKNATAGNLSDDESRWLEYDAGELTTSQKLFFSWRVSSEEHHDVLSFFVNGDWAASISGERPEEPYFFEIPKDGNYVFKWVYSKNGSLSAGEDMGFVNFGQIMDRSFEEVCNESEYCSLYTPLEAAVDHPERYIGWQQTRTDDQTCLDCPHIMGTCQNLTLDKAKETCDANEECNGFNWKKSDQTTCFKSCPQTGYAETLVTYHPDLTGYDVWVKNPLLQYYIDGGPLAPGREWSGLQPGHCSSKGTNNATGETMRGEDGFLYCKNCSERAVEIVPSIAYTNDGEDMDANLVPDIEDRAKGKTDSGSPWYRPSRSPKCIALHKCEPAPTEHPLGARSGAHADKRCGLGHLESGRTEAQGIYYGYDTDTWVFTVQERLQSGFSSTNLRVDISIPPGTEMQQDSTVTVTVKRGRDGQVVRTLKATAESAGRMLIPWDGKNDKGEEIDASYFTYEATATGEVCIQAGSKRCVETVPVKAFTPGAVVSIGSRAELPFQERTKDEWRGGALQKIPDGYTVNDVSLNLYAAGYFGWTKSSHIARGGFHILEERPQGQSSTWWTRVDGPSKQRRSYWNGAREAKGTARTPFIYPIRLPAGQYRLLVNRPKHYDVPLGTGGYRLLFDVQPYDSEPRVTCDAMPNEHFASYFDDDDKRIMCAAARSNADTVRFTTTLKPRR